MPTEKNTEKKTLEYKFAEVKEKPQRAYRKGSKFDPILDAFIKSNKPIVTVVIDDKNGKAKDANYIRTQLKKRIDARGDKVKVSVVNQSCYLEKEVKVSIKAP